MVKYLKSYLSLACIGFAFTDVVSGKSVRYYRDCYGSLWLKDSRWSFFRVAAPPAQGEQQ